MTTLFPFLTMLSSSLLRRHDTTTFSSPSIFASNPYFPCTISTTTPVTISFHALRHSFTSALANAGVAPELRMKLTGHKSESVHAGYTHHELETLRAAVGKLPALHAADTGKRH